MIRVDLPSMVETWESVGFKVADPQEIANEFNEVVEDEDGNKYYPTEKKEKEMAYEVFFTDDGYATVGTLKDIEEQLKDEIVEGIYNKADINGCDTQSAWEALGEIQEMILDHRNQYKLYKLSFSKDGYFGWEINEYEHFLTDAAKMRDFLELTKDEFLQSYSYLTEEEYDNTMELYEDETTRYCKGEN